VECKHDWKKFSVHDGTFHSREIVWECKICKKTKKTYPLGKNPIFALVKKFRVGWGIFPNKWLKFHPDFITVFIDDWNRKVFKGLKQ